MTSGQEGIVITKIQIYTVLLHKFHESETKFCPFPTCPAVIFAMYQTLLYLKTNQPVCLFTHSKGIKIRPSCLEISGVSKVTLSLAMNNPAAYSAVQDNTM